MPLREAGKQVSERTRLKGRLRAAVSDLLCQATEHRLTSSGTREPREVKTALILPEKKKDAVGVK